AAREALGEVPDHGAAALIQQIETTVEVDHRQVRMRGHESQNMRKLVWRVRIYLSGQAHLGEAEPGKLKADRHEQRSCPNPPATPDRSPQALHLVLKRKASPIPS